MNKIVAVAISGGIDSAISAYLLKEMGYEVLGINFQFWTWENDPPSISTVRISLLDDIMEKVGINIEILKYEDLFLNNVVDKFLSEL